MKKIILISILAIFFLAGNAQDDKQEYKTLFQKSNGKASHGGYGALLFGYTQMNSKDVYMFGVKGGWVIDHNVTIGVIGYGFTDEFNYESNKVYKKNISGGYGGLLIEPIIAPHYPVHVSFPIMIGAGGVSYYEHYDYDDCPTWHEDDCGFDWDDDDCCDNYRQIDSDAFFVVEPGVEVELNIVKFMRLGIGGSYRWTSNVALQDHKKDFLHGLSGNISLKFGKF